ncbi:unnamed protein product, partial [Cladocopium goreaui]
RVAVERSMRALSPVPPPRVSTPEPFRGDAALSVQLTESEQSRRACLRGLLQKAVLGQETHINYITGSNLVPIIPLLLADVVCEPARKRLAFGRTEYATHVLVAPRPYAEMAEHPDECSHVWLTHLLFNLSRRGALRWDVKQSYSITSRQLIMREETQLLDVRKIHRLDVVAVKSSGSAEFLCETNVRTGVGSGCGTGSIWSLMSHLGSSADRCEGRECGPSRRASGPDRLRHCIMAEDAEAPACNMDDEVAMRKRVGSPGYVAPEIIMHKPYNEKVDVFAAGVILYFMLRGKLPFSAETQDGTLETINRHVDARPSAFECFYKVYSMASPEVRSSEAFQIAKMGLVRLGELDRKANTPQGTGSQGTGSQGIGSHGTGSHGTGSHGSSTGSNSLTPGPVRTSGSRTSRTSGASRTSQASLPASPAVSERTEIDQTDQSTSLCLAAHSGDPGNTFSCYATLPPAVCPQLLSGSTSFTPVRQMCNVVDLPKDFSSIAEDRSDTVTLPRVPRPSDARTGFALVAAEAPTSSSGTLPVPPASARLSLPVTPVHLVGGEFLPPCPRLPQHRCLRLQRNLKSEVLEAPQRGFRSDSTRLVEWRRGAPLVVQLEKGAYCVGEVWAMVGRRCSNIEQGASGPITSNA